MFLSLHLSFSLSSPIASHPISSSPRDFHFEIIPVSLPRSISSSQTECLTESAPSKSAPCQSTPLESPFQSAPLVSPCQSMPFKPLPVNAAAPPTSTQRAAFARAGLTGSIALLCAAWGIVNVRIRNSRPRKRHIIKFVAVCHYSPFFLPLSLEWLSCEWPRVAPP